MVLLVVKDNFLCTAECFHINITDMYENCAGLKVWGNFARLMFRTDQPLSEQKWHYSTTFFSVSDILKPSFRGLKAN